MLALVLSEATHLRLKSDERVTKDFLKRSWIGFAQTPFLSLRMGGSEPNTDSAKPGDLGRVEGICHAGKCPNSHYSDYAVLNGRNPGGVRDCVFIFRRQQHTLGFSRAY